VKPKVYLEKKLQEMENEMGKLESEAQYGEDQDYGMDGDDGGGFDED